MTPEKCLLKNAATGLVPVATIADELCEPGRDTPKRHFEHKKFLNVLETSDSDVNLRIIHLHAFSKELRVHSVGMLIRQLRLCANLSHQAKDAARAPTKLFATSPKVVLPDL